MKRLIVIGLLILCLNFSRNNDQRIRRVWDYKVYCIGTIGLLYINNIPLVILIPRRGVNE